MNIEDALRDGLGSDIVTCRPDLLERRHRDWSGLPGQPPVALIRPRSTEDVSRALRICHANAQPVVMQGGMTGLAGGACTSDEDVAMTLERMNRILEVDPVSSTITVEAGATLEAVQEAAAAAGLMFPLDLGARGSCTIGGNLATNAGGNRVIKYGTAREQVLGIEAVLADGTVISSLHKMIKNNTGYDLKDLLIGSEGTLGIITKAVLRLRPKAGSVLTAWCGLKDYDAVTTLLGQAQMSLEGGVSAFEVMWPSFVDYIVGHVNGVRAPLESRHNFYVLLESTGMDGESTASRFENFLTEMMEARVIEDASVAQSHADAADFWKVRDATAEFPVLMPDLIAFDVGFSISDAGAAAQRCDTALRARWPNSVVLTYGHLGDGNLHLIVQVPDGEPYCAAAVETEIYRIVREYHGSVSAEHGIGAKKMGVLGYSRTPQEIAVMRSIKSALDPRNILNPGKLLPIDPL